MSQSVYENQPTRRRPLSLPLEAVETAPIVQLFGPNEAVIQQLFDRLGGGDSSVAEISIGGVRISLAIVSGVPTSGRATVMCIADDAHEDSISEALEMLLDGPRPRHLALISTKNHPSVEVERHWRGLLASRGLKDVRIFRVNCDDPMSPELFIKLLLTPIRDAGIEDSGIVLIE